MSIAKRRFGQVNRLYIRVTGDYVWPLVSLALVVTFLFMAKQLAGVPSIYTPIAFFATALVGLLTFFGLRRYHVFSRSHRQITRWWLLFRIVPLFRCRVWEFSSFTSVNLLVETQKDSDGDPYDVYVLKLQGQQNVTIVQSRNYLQVRQIAKDISRVMHIPYFDWGSGDVTIRQPEDIDLLLGERMRRLKPAPDAPPIPQASSFRRIEGADKKTLTLAASPMGKWVTIGALGMCAVFVALPGAFSVASANSGGGWLFIGIGMLGAAVFSFNAYASKFPLTIVISRDSIRFDQSPLYRRTVDATLLDDVVLGATELYLISDKRRFVVPYSFGGKEGQVIGRFVRDSILYELAQAN